MLLAIAFVALLASQQPGTKVVVETTSGRFHVGTVVLDGDHEIVLDVDGRTLTIEKNDVARVTPFAGGSRAPRVPLLPMYPLVWIDAQLGYFAGSGAVTVQPRRFLLGTVRYGGWYEHLHDTYPNYELRTLSFMGGATLKVPIAHVTLSVGPSISTGIGRGRFIVEDTYGEHYETRRAFAAGIASELRVVFGLPFMGLGFFMHLDANTFHSYGSFGFTVELGRISTFRTWRPQ